MRRLLNYLFWLLPLLPLTTGCSGGNHNSFALPILEKPGDESPIDPLQAHIDELNQRMELSAAYCESSSESDLEKQIGPIAVEKDVYDQFKALRFYDNSEETALYTVVQGAIPYYKEYNYSSVESGCAYNIEQISLYPLSNEPEKSTRLFVTHKDYSKELIQLYNKYFFTMNTDGQIHFHGPIYRMDDQFRRTDLNIDNLSNSNGLDKKNLQLTETQRDEALNWLSQSLGIELKDEDKSKLLGDRPYYQTNKLMPSKAITNFSQLPLISLSSSKIGFYLYPKTNANRRVAIQSEENYHQARVVAEMMASFSRGFFTISDPRTEDYVASSIFLILDPNYIYEILNKNKSSQTRMLMVEILKEQKVNPLSMDKEQAQTAISSYLRKSQKKIIGATDLMREDLKDDQKLQEMKLNLVHKTAEAYGIVLGNNTELLMRTRGMKLGTKTKGKSTKQHADELIEDANGFLETYKKALNEIYSSKSYQNAYRFKYPMSQLNEKAL